MKELTNETMIERIQYCLNVHEEIVLKLAEKFDNGLKDMYQLVCKGIFNHLDED